MDCGKNIRKYRQMKGWSQERLAKESGIALRTIGYIESFEGSPTLKTLESIAKALEVSVMVLIERAA